MRISKHFAGLVISLALAGCGSDGTNGGIVAPVKSQTTLQSSDSGVTQAPTSLNAGGATVNVAQGTTLKDATGTPVTGVVTLQATYATATAYLPAADQTLPVNENLKAFLDVVLSTGSQVVKTVNPAIPVSIPVPVPNGTVVDIYSHGTDPGATWVKEGTATVINGSVTFSVSHFSIYACFQQKVTGLTGGGTGGTTAQ
jgi:hypothetical protein